MRNAIVSTLTLAFISTVPFASSASAFDLTSLFGGNQTRVDDCRSGSNFDRCGSSQNHGAAASTVNTTPKATPPSTPPSNPPGCGDGRDKGGKHDHDGHGKGHDGNHDKGDGDHSGHDKGGHDGKGGK